MYCRAHQHASVDSAAFLQGLEMHLFCCIAIGKQVQKCIAIFWYSEMHHAAAGHIAGLLSGGLLSWGISPQYDAADIDIDNRELTAERTSQLSNMSLNERKKAEAEAAELSALDLAADKTTIWAKLLLPMLYATGFVGTVVYILQDRYGHLPSPKWLPDLF